MIGKRLGVLNGAANFPAKSNGFATHCNQNRKLVPAAGFEPARPFGLRILSPLCLPFHHAGTGPATLPMLALGRKPV